MPPPSCPECGFDALAILPRDAAVALRSFPRRFAALARAGEDGDDEGGARTGRANDAPARPDVAVVQAAARASAAEIASLAEQLRLVLIEDQPQLPPDPGASTSAAATPGSDALAALSEATSTAADLAERSAGRAWGRTGTRDGQTVTAQELLAAAVHAGAHRLHQLEGRGSGD